MRKVKVLGLTACSWCNAVKKELDAEGIPYTFLDADELSELADTLEELLRTEDYPIIMVGNEGSWDYVFRAGFFLDMGLHDLPNGSIAIGTHNLEGLIIGTKELLNK